MKYDVKLNPSVQKQLKKLSKPHATRILAKIYRLAEDPYPNGAVQLTGQKAYRIRVGDYRVIYEIHNNQLLVQVIRVGHRRDVYKT